MKPKQRTTEVRFYHPALPVERILPNLLAKIIQSGQKCIFMLRDEERMKQIDNALWSYGNKSFLPHGTVHDPFPDEQPVYLTTGLENPNQATILITVDGIEPPHIDEFDKFFDFVTGVDKQELEQIEKRFNHYKNAGFIVTYWKQDAKGNWEKTR
jgi:DNA polymerase-3 subunit chi